MIVKIIELIITLLFGILIGYFILYLKFYMKRDEDEADERRKKYSKLINIINIPNNIKYNKEWKPNSRGILLFRQQYIPNKNIRGIIGICHGFGDHSQEFLIDLSIRFCKSGYAVISMDSEGHG